MQENEEIREKERDGSEVYEAPPLAEIAERLCKRVDEREFALFREEISALKPRDVAELFDEIPPEYEGRFYRLLPKEDAAKVFVEMDSDRQEKLIDSFTDRELSEMLDELFLDDTVDIIEEMPANVVKRILRNSTSENRSIINQLLRYPKDSAGTVMTTEYVRFTKTMTVEQALSHIRRVAIDKETIYTCYITDKDRHLLGIVTAKALMIAPLDTRLEELMEENVISVETEEDKEVAAQIFDRYGFLALPVVDRENRLVGIITVDDAMAVIHEETEEDFAKMAGMTPTETSYLKTDAFRVFLARIPWLLLLMISATFSSTILNRFEAMLPAVLILFVPMLMDTGGNAGGQSSVTVIRGLSLGEVTFSDLFTAVWKELRVGILCGASLAAVSFGKVMLVDHLIMQNPAVTVTVALAVSLSLALTVIAAKLIGCLLPLFAAKVGLDPAVMASPFITTIVDALSLLLYFFVAAAMLGM